MSLIRNEAGEGAVGGSALCDLSSFWVPFPCGMSAGGFALLSMGLRSLRSCSGRQASPAQELLLTFHFQLLLNEPLGMNHLRCISLQLSIWPTIC